MNNWKNYQKLTKTLVTSIHPSTQQNPPTHQNVAHRNSSRGRAARTNARAKAAAFAEAAAARLRQTPWASTGARVCTLPRPFPPQCRWYTYSRARLSAHTYVRGSARQAGEIGLMSFCAVPGLGVRMTRELSRERKRARGDKEYPAYARIFEDGCDADPELVRNGIMSGAFFVLMNLDFEWNLDLYEGFCMELSSLIKNSFHAK